MLDGPKGSQGHKQLRDSKKVTTLVNLGVGTTPLSIFIGTITLKKKLPNPMRKVFCL